MDNCNKCGKIAEYSDKSGPICYSCIKIKEEALIHPIIAEVVEHSGVSFQLLVSPSRRQEVVEARSYAMYRLRRDTDYTMDRIGKIFYKDHSTVSHAVKTTRILLETDQLAWAKNLD